VKILVTIKRVIDANVRVQVKSDGSGVETASVKMAINPFDLIALEEALRLRERGQASEVVVVCVGASIAQDVLRTALAMGADRAILIEVPNRVEPLGIAKLLKAVVEEEAPGLVIMGKQSIDGDASQTGQILAALLDWPQATFISKLEIAGDTALATREVDGGLQTVEAKLPIVVTTDLRLNEPRYASLPNIMRAKSKPLLIRPAEDFAVDIAPRLEVLATIAPASRTRGRMLDSVAELAGILKAHAN
jgi:electron transfer flavoprotein beta subunit